MTLSHPSSPYLICYLNMFMVGELSVATHVKQMIDPDGDTSTELLGFKQRKREVQCAVTLANKLQVYVDGDIPLFKEKCQAEAAELSEGNE